MARRSTEKKGLSVWVIARAVPQKIIQEWRALAIIDDDYIEVPDEDKGVSFLDDEIPPEDNIASLQRIRAQVGDNALTEVEYATLQAYEASLLPDKKATDHYANLAEHVDAATLTKLGSDVVMWVRWDEESRSDWFEKEKSGIIALGVSPNTEGGAGFDGASTVVHPLLAEAVVQSSARLLDQFWPAGGPVKTGVLGSVTPERLAQAKRVEQFMNYQYTQMLPGAFEHTDSLLTRLPISGSCFVKCWPDKIRGVSRAKVEPVDFIVPYRATDLRTAPRYTERVLMGQNEFRKRQVAGQYVDAVLMTPSENSGALSDRQSVMDEVAASEGRSDNNTDAEDQRRTLLECYCELDLKGFEDKDGNGKSTGIGRPYIVTVDNDSQKVVSIYRNWKIDDKEKERVIYHIHYRFMPGLGFYGYGFYHWIGGIAKTATGALRALLDAAQFSNMPAGFRAKDVSLPNGKIALGPGDWPEIDCSQDDLNKAFVRLPYGEPSAVLFNLLGSLQDMARRFAGTVDALVGDGAQNTPVGTILARIEQGSKVQTAIQKRLHESQIEEFKLIAWLDSIWLPDEYPYAVIGEDRTIKRADFDSRIDVCPVADPNFVSNSQRYFISQMIMDLADKSPGLYDMHEVNRRALDVLRVDDIDKILPPVNKVKRRDPVTENALAIVGQSIKAHPEQAHSAHNAVHQQLMLTMPEGHPAKALIFAHIQEHTAQEYLAQAQAQMGLRFSMPSRDEDEEIPVELENRIAELSAQAAIAQQQSAMNGAAEIGGAVAPGASTEAEMIGPGRGP